eukprot:439679-Pelagomonas_calceolata.AAC.1
MVNGRQRNKAPGYRRGKVEEEDRRTRKNCCVGGNMERKQQEKYVGLVTTRCTLKTRYCSQPGSGARYF